MPLIAALTLSLLCQAELGLGQLPQRSELITPLRIESFNKGGKAKKRVQGGNPRTKDGILLFDGAQDGNLQVDPQIAVGGGHVVHATNSGITIYDKKGNYLDGVPQSEFKNGIDPKLFFDPHNRFFCFDLWVYWDEAKRKPVHFAASETDNPRGAWNVYSVDLPNGVDGGGIGYSRKWIGYSFPGGEERTIIMSARDVKAGKPTRAYHFKNSLGHPVFTQDRMDELFFVHLADDNIILRRVGTSQSGEPMITGVWSKPHLFKHFGWPPPAPMKGTTKTTASGDRNPKNLVVQNQHLWFSHAVNIDGRAAVQWHQFKLNGTHVQSGVVSHPKQSYIQTTVAVNKHSVLLVGFQESGPDTFPSARLAIRGPKDPASTLRPILPLAEGVAATEGGPWGDYSSSCVDGDNLTDLWTAQTYTNDKGKGSVIIARVPQPK